MVSSAPPRTSYDNGQSPEEDWPAQVADQIERVVGTIRDKTTGPALRFVTAIVYGTFIAIVATMVAVLFAIMAVRFVNNYLPDSVFGEEHMWAAHLIIGLAFVIGGAIIWSRRRSKEQDLDY